MIQIHKSIFFAENGGLILSTYARSFLLKIFGPLYERKVNNGPKMVNNWAQSGRSLETKMSRTHAILQRRPELVASATGYVISTPSSMQAGMRGRANIPNRQREKPILTDWLGRRDTCGTGRERREKEKGGGEEIGRGRGRE